MIDLDTARLHEGEYIRLLIDDPRGAFPLLAGDEGWIVACGGEWCFMPTKYDGAVLKYEIQGRNALEFCEFFTPTYTPKAKIVKPKPQVDLPVQMALFDLETA